MYEGQVNTECVSILTSTFVRIMKAYDLNVEAFQIVGKSVALTIDDVALIFGLRKKCRRIHPITRTERPSSKFINKHFKNLKEITNNKIVSAIEKTLPKRKSTDIEDIRRLVCLYLCENIFFTNSNGRIAWSFVQMLKT